MLDTHLDRRPLTRRTAATALIALLTISTGVAGFATTQGVASLFGSIVDPTNAVLPNVTLVLTNEGNGAKSQRSPRRSCQPEAPEWRTPHRRRSVPRVRRLFVDSSR